MMLLVSQHNRETVAHEEQDKQHKGNEVGNGQSNDEVELIVSWREDGDLRDHHREHVQDPRFRASGASPTYGAGRTR